MAKCDLYKLIQLNIPISLNEKFIKIAEKEGHSPNFIIEMLIEEYVEKNRQNIEINYQHENELLKTIIHQKIKNLISYILD